MFEFTYLIKDYLFSASAATGISSGVIGIIAGLLLLLLGYKLKKVALTVIGVVLGAAGGAYLADTFFDPGSAMYVLTPVICGLIGAVLAFVLYRIALYLLGFAVGGAVGIYLSMRLIEQPVWGIVIAVVLALIIGSLALAIEKPIIILGTAFLGYILFRLALYLLIGVDESLVLEIGCLVLLVIGVVIQFLTNRDTERREREYREERGEYDNY
jgi:MFS family permease